MSLKYNRIFQTLLIVTLLIFVNTPCANAREDIGLEPPKEMVLEQDDDMFWNYEEGIYQKDFECSNGESLSCYVKIPPNAKPNMPMIVWLHGIGDGRNPISLLNRGMFYATDMYQEERFIIVQPWTVKPWYKDEIQEAVIELTNSLIEEYHIDKERVALTGHSLGGQGTWLIANKNPEMWNCISPVSGQAFLNIDNLIQYTDLQIRAYAGEFDNETVKNDMNRICIKCQKAGNENVIYSEISKATHSATSYSVYRPDWFDWAFEEHTTEK